MVCDRLYVLAYIPIFMAVAFLFGAMMVYEFKAIWTFGELSFEPEKYLYYQLIGTAPIVLSVLWGIQAIWGLSFIKECFNFCVSGVAVGWYYGRE